MRRASIAIVLLSFCSLGLASDFTARYADRTAIECVYHQHRIGEKPPFEQAIPRTTLERIVRGDQHKETALKTVYGVDITPAMLQAEVKRINTTTRAPEMLDEIKAALGLDTNRFARAFAKPFLVDRLLRERFAQDDQLHATERRQVEQTRAILLTGKASNTNVPALQSLLKERHAAAVREITWRLGPRPAEPSDSPTAAELEARKQFGPNARVISNPANRKADPNCYFSDLPGELQEVLRAQLKAEGDVSAIIEMPDSFALYLASERTAEKLVVSTVLIAKRGFEQWLESLTSQTDGE